MNDNEMIRKRFMELSHRAFERNYTTYSDFLNCDEINILYDTKTETNFKLYGGYNYAQRCVAAFGNETNDYPIVCIKAEPLQQKFADKLNHRDFLGSLMNLGIERDMLGDIIIKDNVGYIFCLDKISNYIINELDRIKHTSIKAIIIKEIPEFINAQPEIEKITVSSIRVDTVTAAVFNISRNSVTQLVNRQKIYINSRTIYKESVLLKQGDIISVRGYGKFVFYQTINETKKHKQLIEVGIYK